MNREDDYSLKLGSDCPCRRQYCFAFLSLFLLLSLAYANSFDCSWHLDDYSNIVANADIQIQNLTWPEIRKGLYGIGGMNRWQRPVSYFSFALNYYFGGLDVFGYHVVNFLIHFISSAFLFLFVFHTLHLPLLRDRCERHAYPVALLSAILWALHPIQVSSVTYIVQRMAGMAGMFYIASMFFYLRGRTATITAAKIAWFGLCILSGVLAMGSKENAAMLPMSLFLYDLILVQGVTKSSLVKNIKYAVPAAMAVLLVGWLYVGDVSVFQEEYKPRVFTMTERLLTQPRVLVFYLSLLFYPLTSRSTLIHDIEISRSLFDPVSTILSLLTVFFIVAAAVFLARKKPLLSYGILFFFLNHLIEGSFIALELIYEHRNYVPSMLLFVPLSLLLVEGLEHYAERKSIVSLLAGAVAFVIVLLGVSVFLQNNIYKTEISLWTDNAEKSPRLHYVRQNLATSYFVAGRLEEAVREANLALSSPLSAGAAAKSRTYGLLGEYYYLKGALDQALLYYLASVKDNPSFHTSYRRISEIMTAKNRLPEAEEMILKALAQNPGSYAYHTILARILLRRGSPDDAIREARISLKLNGDQADPYVILSESFRAKKDNRAALHFRKVADAFQLRGRQQQAAAFAHQVAP